MADQARRKKLKKFLREQGMTRQQAADFFDVSIHTMHAYLKPVDNASWRAIPDYIMDVIK